MLLGNSVFAVETRTGYFITLSTIHDENYAASNGNFLPTFRDNLSIPSSGAKLQPNDM
jgi:hypothetical protein